MKAVYLIFFFMVFYLIISFISGSISYSATPRDSTITTLNYTISDSLHKNIRPSLCPIIAFGFLGALTGGAIGGALDPPKKGIEGEMSFNISKTGAIGFSIGAFVGGYIGYKLSKRDVEREKHTIKNEAP